MKTILVTQEEHFYEKEFKSINELIEKFNNIFNLPKRSIETLAPGLSKLQKEFNSKFLRYINIKRFAIPVIGRISSGKSTFLNSLLGLNNILESNTDITTKFVCIIRHNQLLNEPKAYSVILEERKEEKNIENWNLNPFPKFNFEKGEELKGDIKEIIIQRNKKINENKNELLKKEDYFMIIETKIPIFNKDNMIKYSEIFEFMDLPGLNEKEGVDNFFRKNILPVISYNTKFSFFIFDCLSIKDNDTIEIYESFINLLDIKIENCFYILNKIDLSSNEKEVEINNFKNYINKRFNVDINKNHFLGINSLLLSKESQKYNNFDSYLIYKINEIQDGDGNSFILYLKQEMEKDLKISINLKNCENPILNGQNSKINDLIDNINNQLIYKNFRTKLNYKNYLKFSDIFQKINTVGEDNLNDVKEILDKLFSSMINSVESFINLTNYENQLNDLMNKIMKKSNDGFYLKMEKIKQRNYFKYSTKRINELKYIIDNLSILEPNDKFIKNIVQEYDDLVNYINKDRKIRIALLGLYSSGKSTILNAIIGKKILPTSSGECTRRGIIIRYHNNNTPELYKTKFIQKSDYYFFEDSNEPVCTGFDNVKKELEKLNKVNEKFEDSFYILKIKIEFYDEYQIENELKERIELIDFPGLHTENNFYEQNIFGHLMKFTDGFIFINKNDLIKEKSNVDALTDIINRIESRKFSLNTDTFLFTLNNYTEKELKIEKAKKELDEIVFGKIYEKKGFWEKLNFFGKEQKYETKLNVVQFNAKYYEQHIDFKEKFNDFENFMKTFINDMQEEGENDLLKYFNDNYFSRFKNTAIDKKIDDQIIDLSDKLYKVLYKPDDKNDEMNYEKIKNTLYLICQRYQAMKNNLKDDEKYKQSNALEFFHNIKKQFQIAKSNLDDNFKFIYNNFIKSLVYTFYLINLNILGNNLCRNIKIDNLNKEIDTIYKNYSKIILKEKQNLEINSFNKIDYYINNIDSFSDPQKKGVDIANDISNLYDKFIKLVNEKIEEYKKELKKINEKFKNSIENNLIDNFDDFIFKQFFSRNHAYTHLAILGGEAVFGVGLYASGAIASGSIISGPIGWVIGIGIHGIIAYCKYKYDLSHKKDTL